MPGTDVTRVNPCRHRLHALALARQQQPGQIRAELPAKSLAYLDPPYLAMGRRAKLYHNHYKPDDHAVIAGAPEMAPWPWVVSYDAEPEILRLYHRKRRLLYGIGYSAAERYDGSEVMFFSGELAIPAASSPLKSSQAA
jgi:DNA adenine methylase